jgi:hypothetical protein
MKCSKHIVYQLISRINSYYFNSRHLVSQAVNKMQGNSTGKIQHITREAYFTQVFDTLFHLETLLKKTKNQPEKNIENKIPFLTGIMNNYKDGSIYDFLENIQCVDFTSNLNINLHSTNLVTVTLCKHYRRGYGIKLFVNKNYFSALQTSAVKYENLNILTD